MTRNFKYFFWVISSAILYSCNTANNNTPANMSPKTEGLNIDKSKLATLKDVACGMSMAKIAIHDTAVINGKIYPFCSAECKDMFKKHPENYTIN